MRRLSVTGKAHNTSTFTRALLTLLIPALLAGCASSPSAAGIALDPDGRTELTYDEQFMEIAGRVPAFAGLYVDGDVYVIKVTDGSQDTAESARRAAADILDHPELATGQIRPEAATYSWRQLFTWYQDFNEVLSWEGVVLTDIDEMGNAIEIAVSDLDRYGPRVRSLADANHIPTDALRVIESEPIRQVPLIEERPDN